MLQFSKYLAEEWSPALGCTEPASIAYAAASAARVVGGEVKAVHLVCDPRIYKNCYAVGIPHSGHKTGLRWALATGAFLPDPEARLECFRQLTPAILERAGALIESGVVTVDVDRSRRRLFVDCRVISTEGVGRAVIEGEHTRLVSLEENNKPLPLKVAELDTDHASIRAELASLSFEELLEGSRQLSEEDRQSLRQGARLNIAIANHGLSLFPKNFVDLAGQDPLTRISRLVCAGVYARMSGEDFVVMSLAGSGNKGITCSIPLTLWGRGCGLEEEKIDEALALACLFTSSTTHHLGTLSAVCGCSNAAGIGLAAGLVALRDGGPKEISLAVQNMVGNVTGMICDGAKIGCALKTMTSVDAAFRASSLAMDGIGIPSTDGIIGQDGVASLANLGRIATRGMTSMDDEILGIMQEKIRKSP